MKSSKSFDFKEVARLRFFDIKSQKKTIQYKKFCNIELSSQEKVKQKYQSVRTPMIQECQNENYSRSYRRSNLKKSIDKLAQPKTQVSIDGQECKQVNKILKKCKKLMSHGNRFKNQMSYFERHSRSCLGQIQRKMNNAISDGLGTNYYM